MGLAYEIVINSSPCISYYMEEKHHAAASALTIAHAAFGHNHFFKNNYLFQQWTDADGVLDYLEYAKKFVAKCEEEHGMAAVEDILDAAHAIMDHGVSRYPRPHQPTTKEKARREQELEEYRTSTFNDLWRTVPDKVSEGADDDADEDSAERVRVMNLPEENLLYFVETYSRSWRPGNVS